MNKTFVYEKRETEEEEIPVRQVRNFVNDLTKECNKNKNGVIGKMDQLCQCKEIQ